MLNEPLFRNFKVQCFLYTLADPCIFVCISFHWHVLIDVNFLILGKPEKHTFKERDRLGRFGGHREQQIQIYKIL